MPKNKSLVGIWIAVASSAIGAVLAATTYILIPRVELGAGVGEMPACLSNSVADFSLSTSGALASLRVTGIGPDCASQWVRLSLFTSSDGTGIPVEQVVWQIPAASNPPVTTYTVRANGTNTGLVSGVVWPSSETSTGGILTGASAIVVSSINSFLLETSDTALTDSY